MQPRQAAKILRLHFSEQDTYEGRPLHEAIIAKCQELSIAGATAFRGLAGFGVSAAIHRHHRFAIEEPILLTIIDSDENILRLLPELEEMMGTGLIAISD